MFLLILSFALVENVQSKGTDFYQDSLARQTDSLKIDSLFKSINRSPSETETQWVLSKLKSADSSPYIIAVIALFGILIQLYFQSRFQSKQASLQIKKDRVDRLYNSLQWFEGDTQKRSIGIAMIEANWNEETDFQKIWIPVLINQAIYLLLQSGQNKAPHEIANLKRIMALLANNKETYFNQFKQGFEQLTTALNSRKVDGKPEEEKDGEGEKHEKNKPKTHGLDLSGKTDLEDFNKWKVVFG